MRKLNSKEKDAIKKHFDKVLETVSKRPGVATVNGKLEIGDCRAVGIGKIGYKTNE